MDSTHLDWGRITDLAGDLDPEDLSEVLTLFFAEIEGALADLAQADEHAPHWAERLHFIKSGALNLGFAALANIAGKGERDADSGRLDLIDPAEITASYRALRAEFEAELPSRLPGYISL